MKTLLLVCLSLLLQHSHAATRPLTIVAENYAPSTFIENGQVSGFDVDIAKAVFDRLGVSYTIQLVPVARALSMLKNGQADAGLHFSYSDERTDFLEWPKTAVWNADFVFMTTKATKARYQIKTLADVKRTGLTVGITQNNIYHPDFWKTFPSPDRENLIFDRQLDPASDATTNLKKLAAGRIQLFPFPLILGRYMTRIMKLDTITNYDWIIFSKPYPNTFAKNSTWSSPAYPDIHALMQAYNTELARLKSDPVRFNRFFQRYGVEIKN